MLMRSVRLVDGKDLKGELDFLIENVAKPNLNPGEVLVEIKASGINMSDVKLQKRAFPHVKFPITTGRDFSGIVKEIGSEVNSDWKNKNVWGSGGGDFGFKRDGTHSEYIVMKEKDLNEIPIPKEKNITFTFNQAAASLTPFITAYGPLKELINNPNNKNKTLLVTGAAGMVGTAALQLGSWKGLTTISVVRSEKDKNIKADHKFVTSDFANLKKRYSKYYK